jgi:hypothetical protein
MPIQHNFHEVQAHLQQLFAQHEQGKLKMVRTVVVQAYADIERISPVDQGRYRASHSMTISDPKSRDASGEQSKSAYSALARQNMADVQAKMEAIQQLPQFMQIFVVNTLPYANRLEHGWSQQAPSGVYTIAAQRAERLIDKFRKRGINLA